MQALWMMKPKQLQNFYVCLSIMAKSKSTYTINSGLSSWVYVINGHKHITPFYIPCHMSLHSTDGTEYGALLDQASKDASQVHLELIPVNIAMNILHSGNDDLVLALWAENCGQVIHGGRCDHHNSHSHFIALGQGH